MFDLPRRGRVAAVTLLAFLLLTGCGGGTLPTGAAPAAPPSPTPAQQSAPASVGETAGATTGATTPSPGGEADLPWPAAGAAEAAALQAAADSGAQPWLLDPGEVAVSYAAAAHGWTDAEAHPGPDGTTVDVRRSDGRRLALTLAQPGRTGKGGIWVVTTEHGG